MEESKMSSRPASSPPFAPEKAIFLFGCARSGTSILGEALAAHPRITYLFEASALWKKAFPGRPDDRLTAEDARDGAAVRSLCEEYAARLTDPARDLLLEKNPKNTLRVGFLAAAFPGCRLLHLLRDGRDTVASLMFRNRGPEWGHLKIPGWKELLEKYPAKNHLRCACQWRDSVRLARAEARALPPERCREVKYEELVARPLETVEQVLAFLGLEGTDGVRQAARRIQDSTAGSYHARGQVRHYLDNHARRVGRYRENLTPEQLREVLEICGDLLEELGYG